MKEEDKVKQEIEKRKQKKREAEKNKAKKKVKEKKISTEINNENNLEKVYLRNLVSYSNYRKLISLTAINVMILFVCIFATYKFYIKPVPPRYIPLTQSGSIIPNIPISDPNLNDGQILDFALKAVRNINMYDYENWKEELTNSRGFFTVDGWNSFLAQFQQSNNINTVKDLKMVVNLTPLSPPVIIRKGRAENAQGQKTYVWMVEIPSSIKYLSSIGNISKSNNVTGVIRLTIIRVDTTDNPSGVGIVSYLLDTSRTKVAS